MGWLAATLCLLLTAPTLSAQPVTYNYLDISYVQSESGNVDATGYGAKISAPLPSSNNFLYAEYTKVEFDDSSNTEAENLRLGLGLVSPSRSAGGLYTLVTFERAEIDGERDEGYGGEVGLRLRLGEYFEVGAAARYQDLKNAGDDTGYAANAVLTLAPTFSVLANLVSIADRDELRFGVRLTMGPD